MQSAELEAIIRSKVEGVQKLVVSDVSGGCGQAFDVIIVSPVFDGLPTLKRHRMVNDLLKDQIAQLHAFSQKTYTPAQYEALSGNTSAKGAAPSAAKDDAGTSAAAAVPASSTSPAVGSASPSGAAQPFRFGSLAAPSTPPSKSRSGSAAAAAAHGRTASNVSIPELTLTTDDETLSGQAAHGAPRPLTPSAQPGGTTSHLPDMHASPQSPAPSISRLHYNKISSPEFWEGLRAYLESQLITNAPGSPAPGVESNPLASPSAGSNSNSTHVRGEAELIRLFEEFLQSQKPHLSASDVAKVRDGTGMFGM